MVWSFCRQGVKCFPTRPLAAGFSSSRKYEASTPLQNPESDGITSPTQLYYCTYCMYTLRVYAECVALVYVQYACAVCTVERVSV